VLGHAHVSTTAASYAHVDEQAMVRALARVNDFADLAARRASTTAGEVGRPGAMPGFAFDYDPETARELDAAATAHPATRRPAACLKPTCRGCATRRSTRPRARPASRHSSRR
jgi:hypothetical protein